MSVVKINAIEIPPGAGPELEKRFANRAHAVDNQQGFLGFQLLRPVKDEDRYFVVTTWESEEAFQAWATGPAIQARWGKPLNELPADHPAFAMEADYLGQLAVNLLLTASPSKLIFGGGVMNCTGLLPMIRAAAARHLNDYLDLADPSNGPDELIVTPGLESNAGLLGAAALVIEAA